MTHHHQLASNLFIAAEKLGTDTPTEGAVVDALDEARYHALLEAEEYLLAHGHVIAARCVVALQHGGDVDEG